MTLHRTAAAPHPTAARRCRTAVDPRTALAPHQADHHTVEAHREAHTAARRVQRHPTEAHQLAVMEAEVDLARTAEARVARTAAAAQDTKASHRAATEAHQGAPETLATEAAHRLVAPQPVATKRSEAKLSSAKLSVHILNNAQ